MKENPSCSISFNPEIAFTIRYSDSEPGLLFVFELGDSPKAVILHRHPLDAQSKKVVVPDSSSRSHLSQAFDSVSGFLEECGYKVEPYGKEL